MISEGNDPTPFCFHSLRHASVRSQPAAGEPAAGHPLGDRLSRPRSSNPDVAIGSPQERPKGRLGLEPPGQAWDPWIFSHLGACRRGCRTGSPGAGPEPSLGSPAARPRPARRHHRARRHPRLACCGRATPAARVLDRKAPSDQGLVVILHYSC